MFFNELSNKLSLSHNIADNYIIKNEKSKEKTKKVKSVLGR